MGHEPLEYPLKPKSIRYLRAGDFWAVPLADGSFGCGRVIDLPAPTDRQGRMIFLAGILDWRGSVPPSSDSIAGARCIDQGEAHIRTILRTGGAILGWRNLSADGIEPWLFRGAAYHRNSFVFKGCTPVRPQTSTDSELPVRSVWGYNVVTVIAESHFGVHAKG